jgi:hypothetical protein
MKLTKYLSVVAIAALFAACSGETGPAGPAGATGPTGPTGNANVTNQIVTVNASNWSTNLSFPWEIDVTGTASLNTDGAIECYFSYDQNSWTALSWVSTGTPPYYEMQYSYSSTAWAVSWFNITNESSAPAAPSVCYFNFVEIPPSIQNKYPNKNWQNASDVMYVPEVQKALNSNK